MRRLSDERLVLLGLVDIHGYGQR